MASAPSIPDPNQAAVAGVQADLANYPFQYIVNALSQTGGKGTVDGQTFDFTGLGQGDVSATMTDKMAQTLLDIQQGLGPQYIAQRLADLKQSDPIGYAARQDLFDSIMADASKAAPNAQLSADTQQAVLAELQQGTSLDARELEQVQQGVRGDQLARGVYLGNAPTQQETNAVLAAGDQAQTQRQALASQFQASGVSPEDIQYRKIQQDLQNLGSFLSNQTPTAEFGSLSGAQSQAAPTPNTGYQPFALNPNAAQQGVQNAFGLYSGQVNWAENNVNPYLAGLEGLSGVGGTAFSLGWKPWTTAPADPLGPDVG